MPPAQPQRSRLRVVLFSGGRGSGALTEQLVQHPAVELTIAINGYDDGASTGEVRRFLGDALGPSDFRKNAARLARLLATAPAALIDLLDVRLNVPLSEATLETFVAPLPPPSRSEVAERLERFLQELHASGRPFDFDDCSVGNLVFAGGFLRGGRDFNCAVDDYCALVGLPPARIENVTDGTNAYLVAIDADGRLLGSEEEIVDAKRRNRIEDIFLIDRRLTSDDLAALSTLPPPQLAAQLETWRAPVRLNGRLERAIAQADLVIYAPGTQHSSLFPSYLTPGLSTAIAANLTAIKLLVTNIQTDAEITGRSAVDIIDRAVFYLKEKGRQALATPCLITHYLVNDPGGAGGEAPYVPLGRLDSLEDPRLVRVANYEEGLTGRHDATKILGPFVESFVARWQATQKVAVVLHEATTANKAVQTILEMIRAGVRDLPIAITVFHDGPGPVDAAFASSPGFDVRWLAGTMAERDRRVREAIEQEGFDYVISFESSGMYNGEDVKTLASYLSSGRLDAVWGSRRLSVRDIHESYRLKYRRRALLGGISYVGSHILSLLYLALYGRYVSDTLSAAWAVRADDVLRLPVPLEDKLANQHLLSILLGRRAEMFEVPVQFFSISPAQVRRTSVLDGLRAMATAVVGRFRAYGPSTPAAAMAPSAGVQPQSSHNVQVR